MSTNSPFRRRLGRSASPPTWAWYEQIPFPEDDSDNTNSSGDEADSCSEDEGDYGRNTQAGGGVRPASPSESDSASEDHRRSEGGADAHGPTDQVVDVEMSEKVDHEGNGGTDIEVKKDLKGKQRAVDPPEVVDDESPRRRERRKKHREPMAKFRPILTIQKSHGFVWNQDLFVPPYIKDRYVASTSPPDHSGCLSSYNDYEVEVVEIRVNEGDLANIIPSR